jgi:hypothetical protein
MRTVRNITVAVEPELYRQTRKIADYDTTITDMVRFPLLAPSATPAINPSIPSPEKSEISSCKPVNASQPHSIQQLAIRQPAPVQDKYPCISPLKAIIPNALRPIP